MMYTVFRMAVAFVLVLASVGAVWADTTVLIPNRGGVTTPVTQPQVPARNAVGTPSSTPYPQQNVPYPQQPVASPQQPVDDEETWFLCSKTSDCGAIPGPCNAPYAVNVAYMEQFKRSMASQDLNAVSCPKLSPQELEIMATLVPMCMEGHCAVAPRELFNGK